MKSFEQEYVINAPLAKIWHAFVDQKEIGNWGAGPAEMTDQVGGSFKLWGGDIWGKNIEVIPEKKLVQDWYGGKWERPSKVTFTFKEKDAGTSVRLVHENLPDDQAADFEQGWKDYYLGAIKKYLEE